MSGLLWTLVLLPAGAGGLLAVSGADRRTEAGADDEPAERRTVRRPVRLSGWFAPALAVVVATVTLGFALTAAVLRPSACTPFLPEGPLALAVDGLTALVTVTVAAITLLVLLFAAAGIRHERPRFFGLMLLFEAAVLLTATATTLTGLLLAWEIMGATSYALIAFHWREHDPVAAGGTAFITTRAGDLGLYLAAGAALTAGSAAMPALSLAALAEIRGPWLHVAAAGVLAAAFGKAAQLPFSFWLSRAMLGPSPVSALLHSAAMVAMGGYLLLRMRPLLETAGWAATAAAWGGAVTALLLGAVAVGQRDLKQLLAASTSAQLGFVVLAAGAGSLAGGAAHFVAHAAVKSLLFLGAGAWLAVYGTQQLSELHGAARRHRAVGTAVTVGALALAGLPPLSLWATKDEILAAVESPALHGVAFAAALLSSAYAGKALGLILRPRHPDLPVTEKAAGQLPKNVRPVPVAALGVLAAGAAALAVLALPPLSSLVKKTIGAPDERSASVSTLLLSALLALAVTAVAAVLAPRLPEPRWARTWLGLEAAARAVVVRPTVRLAHLLARFDDHVLDRAVMATAPGVRRLAAWAGSADRSGVDGLVHGVADGARKLGGWARRPQTGQLHQYYAQALALLAAAVVLLLLLR